MWGGWQGGALRDQQVPSRKGLSAFQRKARSLVCPEFRGSAKAGKVVLGRPSVRPPDWGREPEAFLFLTQGARWL